MLKGSGIVHFSQVDTGATVTMVSTASIKYYCEVQVKEPSMKVFTADDDELAVEGEVNLEMEIGNHLFKTLALVANLQVEGILGLDMIKSLGVIIDAKQNVLSLNDDRIPMVWEGKCVCFKIVAMDKDNSPSRSEFIASEKICTMNKGQSQSKGTAQSTGREDARDQYTTANGRLVENKAAVRLCKVEADSKVVYQNTEFSQCCIKEKTLLVEMSKQTCRLKLNSLYNDLVKHHTRKARKVKPFVKMKGNKRHRHSILVNFRGKRQETLALYLLPIQHHDF